MWNGDSLVKVEKQKSVEELSLRDPLVAEQGKDVILGSQSQRGDLD